MLIRTTRFGEIEISEESILQMPDGMMGFQSSHSFILLEDQPNTPVKWLQAVDNESLAFVVINPMEFFPDYDIVLADDDVEFLGLENPTDAAIITTVTIDKNDGLATTNLLGPVVINSKTLIAKQIVLSDDRYGTKHIVGAARSNETERETAKAA